MNRRNFFTRLVQATIITPAIALALPKLRAAAVMRAKVEPESIWRARAELAGAKAFSESLKRQIADIAALRRRKSLHSPIHPSNQKIKHHMKTQLFKISVHFIEPLLGSASGDPEVHQKFIANRAMSAEQAEEEIASIPVDEQIEKATTIFSRHEGHLHLWDYQVRGFFKEAITALVELGDCKLSKSGVKKAVDSFLFVEPRRILLLDKAGTPISRAPEKRQRPLRAQTMQGERIALASSEELPVGTRIDFALRLLISGRVGDAKKPARFAIIDEDLVRAALDYGAFKGMGQWRSGGFGRFDYKLSAP